jgi:hypothetical protein
VGNGGVDSSLLLAREAVDYETGIDRQLGRIRKMLPASNEFAATGYPLGEPIRDGRFRGVG